MALLSRIEMNLEEFYNKNYKKLLILPAILLIVSVSYIYIFSTTHGDIIDKDVSLRGGVSATFYVNKEIPLEEINSKVLNEFRDSDVFVRRLEGIETANNGYIIEASNIESPALELLLEREFDIELNEENFFVEETGSRLGEAFYRDMIFALITAFVLMGIVVLITYRSLIPSLAVISSAFFDIVVTIALIDLFGIRVSSAGIAALILLMAYSVDTDVLLTAKVLKNRNDKLWNRLKNSAKTGLTMTATTFVAMIVAFIFSTSLVFRQMFIIIAMGLMVDVIATYVMNASILKWYMLKKYNEN